MVFVRDQHVVMAQNGGFESRCLNLSGAAVQKLAQADSIAETTRVLLAVAATAWAMGIAPELITAGIETSDQAPKPVR